MRYVIAGYVVILTLLFLYAVQLVWRRRRLAAAVVRVAGTAPSPAPAADPSVTGGPGS
jgi:hypothetical protein